MAYSATFRCKSPERDGPGTWFWFLRTGSPLAFGGAVEGYPTDYNTRVAAVTRKALARAHELTVDLKTLQTKINNHQHHWVGGFGGSGAQPLEPQAIPTTPSAKKLLAEAKAALANRS